MAEESTTALYRSIHAQPEELLQLMVDDAVLEHTLPCVDEAADDRGHMCTDELDLGSWCADSLRLFDECANLRVINGALVDI